MLGYTLHKESIELIVSVDFLVYVVGPNSHRIGKGHSMAVNHALSVYLLLCLLLRSEWSTVHIPYARRWSHGSPCPFSIAADRCRQQ